MNRWRLEFQMAWLAVLALFAIAVPAAAEERSPRTPSSCRYVEAGPPGASGDQLVLVGNQHGILRREGDRIVFIEPELMKEVPCGGPPATVHSIDRIVYRGSRFGRRLEIDLSGGPLAPGVTPEKGGDEIEVEARFPKVIRAPIMNSLYVTTGEAGRLRIGALRGGGIGLDLNPQAGESKPDADILARTGWHPYLRVFGSDGPDILDASGRGRAFAGPALLKRMLLYGEGGDDLLVGGLGHDLIEGDDGDDTIRAGGGPDEIAGDDGVDTIHGDSGSDRITGGEGSDRLFGGSGEDTLEAEDLFRDQIVCGRGDDLAWVDSLDEPDSRSCELWTRTEPFVAR